MTSEEYCPARGAQLKHADRPELETGVPLTHCACWWDAGVCCNCGDTGEEPVPAEGGNVIHVPRTPGTENTPVGPMIPGTELLPCPFCGKTDKLTLDHLTEPDDWFIECERCDVGQHAVHTKDASIAAWNTRKPAASPVAGVSANDLVDIGTLRRELFMDYDSPWNGWVRDTTASIETESGVSRSQMMRKMAQHGADLLYKLGFLRNIQPSAEGDGELPENLVEGIEWWKDGENPAAFTESGLRDFINDLIKHVSVGKGAEGDGWIAELRDGLKLVRLALADENLDGVPTWTRMRFWLNQRDIYNGDLQEHRVTLEVVKKLLTLLPTPPSGQGAVK